MKCLTHLGRAVVLMLLSAPIASLCAAQAQTPPGDDSATYIEGLSPTLIPASTVGSENTRVESSVHSCIESDVLQLSALQPDDNDHPASSLIPHPASTPQAMSQASGATSWSPRRPTSNRVAVGESEAQSADEDAANFALSLSALPAATYPSQEPDAGGLASSDFALHCRKRHIQEAKRRRALALKSTIHRQCIEQGMPGPECSPALKDNVTPDRSSDAGLAPALRPSQP